MDEETMKSTLLAVNGTLMRGLELNANLLDAGARFVRDDETDACYRIWSIGDRHPAMLRTPGEGTHVAVELWDVPVEGLARILLAEPPGLAIVPPHGRRFVLALGAARLVSLDLSLLTFHF